jgi:hypothetical protein
MAGHGKFNEISSGIAGGDPSPQVPGSIEGADLIKSIMDLLGGGDTGEPQLANPAPQPTLGNAIQILPEPPRVAERPAPPIPDFERPRSAPTDSPPTHTVGALEETDAFLAKLAKLTSASPQRKPPITQEAPPPVVTEAPTEPTVAPTGTTAPAPAPGVFGKLTENDFEKDADARSEVRERESRRRFLEDNPDLEDALVVGENLLRREDEAKRITLSPSPGLPQPELMERPSNAGSALDIENILKERQIMSTPNGVMSNRFSEERGFKNLREDTELPLLYEILRKLLN